MDMGLPLRYILLSLLVHGLVFAGLAYRPGGELALLEVRHGPTNSLASEHVQSSAPGSFQVLVSGNESPVKEAVNEKKQKKGELDPGEIRGVLSRQARELARNRGPVYPRLALLHSQEGVCVIELEVRSDGKVRKARVLTSSGYSVLDEAAREAALSWRFDIPGGVSLPDPVRIRQRIVFRLE
jgi:TonB family protein